MTPQQPSQGGPEDDREPEPLKDEIAKEIARKKFTLAELEEEEQSLDRLRRWFRAIRSRDVFGSAAAGQADQELAGCAAALDGFAALVYADVHS